MIKMSRNHAMQIWGKLNDQEENEFPIGWDRLGLKFLAIDQFPRLTTEIFDRLLYFNIINKHKFTWLTMQFDIEYEPCNIKERRLYQNLL